MLHVKLLTISLLFSFSCLLMGQDEAGTVNQLERILNFHCDIRIDTTGRMEVKEYITVFANQDNIKRGIFRQIPIYRTDKNGKKKKVGIKVLSVSRDGESENFTEKTENGHREIRVGNKDYILPSGIYEYLIVYETYGQVGFFDDFDELYWNITGNDWGFQIEKASASIILPDNATFINTACYTGHMGDTENNCFADTDSAYVRFATTDTLLPREGFTVAVSFPRDIIKRPPPPSKEELLWMKYRQYICAALGLLILGCFYFFTWRKVGIDPEKPVAVPTFKPPHDWSPAAIRYLYKRKYDSKAFSATIISLATKHYLRIEDISKKYKLIKTESQIPLPSEELTVYLSLLSKRDKITVSDTYHKIFSKAEEELKRCLNKKWSIKEYFLKNISYIVLATTLNIFVSILFCIFALSDSPIESSTPIVSIGFFILMFIGYFIYFYLIKAPTKLGAKTTAELEGFRMYLKTAEGNRLNLLTPPERTPELFEKMLPYAIALGVENEWGKKFYNVLQQANYDPDWYNGNTSFSSKGFAHSFPKSFALSVASAKISPSSSSGGSSGGSWSSGSSGGGSSGGGGGGGGGW